MSKIQEVGGLVHIAEDGKVFAANHSYTRTVNGITWKDKRDLDHGYSRLIALYKKGASEKEMVLKTKLPVRTIKDVISMYKLVEHYPDTATILDRRLAGRTIQQIATEFGISTEEIRGMLEIELRDMEGPAGQYAVEVARCEKFFSKLMPEIETGNFQAMQLAIRISEHKLAIIQTQIEAAKAISSSKLSLSAILHELDNEQHEQKRLTNESREREDESGGYASSITDV